MDGAILVPCADSTRQIGSTPELFLECVDERDQYLWPVELGREETRSGLEDLVRPPQLGVLPA
nr:hypothetical protein [Actinomadura geliboluensis]